MSNQTVNEPVVQTADHSNEIQIPQVGGTFFESLLNGTNPSDTLTKTDSSVIDTEKTESESGQQKDTPEANDEEKGKEQEAVKTPEEAEAEPKGEEATEDDGDSFPITLKVKGKEHVFDFNDEAQREKLINLAQQGTDYNEKMQTVNTKENLLNISLLTMGAKNLYNLATSEDGIVELPYEYFKERANNEKEAITQYNQHKREIELANSYVNKASESARVLAGIRTNFVNSHPEISNLEEWEKTNLYPYLTPVISYGEVAYPDDVYEMIHFWKNKDQIIQDAKRETLKTIAEKKPIRKYQVGNGGVKTNKSGKPQKGLVSQIFPRQ